MHFLLNRFKKKLTKNREKFCRIHSVAAFTSSLVCNNASIARSRENPISTNVCTFELCSVRLADDDCAVVDDADVAATDDDVDDDPSTLPVNISPVDSLNGTADVLAPVDDDAAAAPAEVDVIALVSPIFC